MYISIAPKKCNYVTAALNSLPPKDLTRYTLRYKPNATVTVDNKMSLWSKIAEGAKPTPSQIETIPPPVPPVAIVHHVSEPEYWPIGFEEWVPPVLRGLMVVFPAADWEITASMVEERHKAAQGGVARRAPAVDTGDPLNSPCPICQGFLFWEAIGDPSSHRCVTCQPPTSPRMVEDLWLFDGEEFDCVSDNPRWQRAAFEVYERGLARQQAAMASRVAAENAGF